MDETKVEYFECACHSDEHTLKFALDPGFWEGEKQTDEPELYTSVFLGNYPGFFKRIWIAIKYVFGYKCKYGHWDCFLIKKDDTDRLIKLLEEYKRN